MSLECEIANNIIGYVDENDIDLVIMGSEGISNGNLQTLLLGSVANKVIHSIKNQL